jgi:hypothetical protein
MFPQKEQWLPEGSHHTSASSSVSRILSRTIIHLGGSLPIRSCGLPGTLRRAIGRPCLALLRVGFAKP